MSLSGGDHSLLGNQISPKIPKIDITKRLANLEEVEFSFKPSNLNRGQSRYCSNHHDQGQPNIPDDISIIPSNLDSNTQIDDTIRTVNNTPKDMKASSTKVVSAQPVRRFDEGLPPKASTPVSKNEMEDSGMKESSSNFHEIEKEHASGRSRPGFLSNPNNSKINAQNSNSNSNTNTSFNQTKKIGGAATKPPKKRNDSKLPKQGSISTTTKKSKTPDHSQIIKNNNLSRDYSMRSGHGDTVRSQTPNA